MAKRRSSTSRRSSTKKTKTEPKNENDNVNDSQEESQGECVRDECKQSKEEEGAGCYAENECKQQTIGQEVSKEQQEVNIEDQTNEEDKELPQNGEKNINTGDEMNFAKANNNSEKVMKVDENEVDKQEAATVSNDDATKEHEANKDNTSNITEITEKELSKNNLEMKEKEDEKLTSTVNEAAIPGVKDNNDDKEIVEEKTGNDEKKDEIIEAKEEKESSKTGTDITLCTSGNLVDVDEFDATDSQLCVLEEAEAKNSTTKDLCEKENLGIRSGSSTIKDLMQDLADMNRLITRAKNEIHTTKMKLSNENWKKKI